MSFLHLHAHSLWQTIKQSIRQWVKPDTHSPVPNAALDLSCSKSELMVENVLLRQQLIIVQRETKRPKITWRDRALIVFLTSKLRRGKGAVIIVKPDALPVMAENSIRRRRPENCCPGRKLYPSHRRARRPNLWYNLRSRP